MNEKVNARIQALEAELAGLKKELAEPKKDGRFRAKYSEPYYFVGRTLDVELNYEQKDILDDAGFDNFNYFQMEQEAEAMAEKTKLMFEMTARVKELNGDWVADWGLNNQELKFGLMRGARAIYTDWQNNNYFIFGLSVQSAEHAEILLEEFKERIERWY